MTDEPDELTPQPKRKGGVFISRGMSIQIPVGGLKISLGGDTEPDMSLTLHVSLDIHPYWLEIALSHLERASAAHEEVLTSWKNEDQQQKGRSLEADFVESLQSIMASAIAVDAFYAVVKRHTTIPPKTLTAWKTQRTARYRQIAEVFRRAFLVGPQSAAQMRSHLKELFKWRDWSVHPSSRFDQPLWYPELNVATEWRFVAFNYSNAKAAASVALSLVAQLLSRPRPNSAELVRYCEGALPLVLPLVERWESRYGELYPLDSAGDTGKEESQPEGAA